MTRQKKWQRATAAAENDGDNYYGYEEGDRQKEQWDGGAPARGAWTSSIFLDPPARVTMVRREWTRSLYTNHLLQ